MCRNFVARVYSRSTPQIKLSRALAHTPRHCGVPAASESGFRSKCARRRLEAKVHICACARPAHVFVFLKPFRDPACVCACVRVDMLLSVSRSPKLKGETDSQCSGTGGGGRAAHTCSAQIRLICLGLASHCLPSLPLSRCLHTGAASFSALGLFQQRWVSVFQIPHCQRKRGGTDAGTPLCRRRINGNERVFFLPHSLSGLAIPPSLMEGSSFFTRKIVQKHSDQTTQ